MTSDEPMTADGDDTIRCARCGREDVPPLARPPFPDELGRRITEEVCVDCWEDWKRRQMLLINHYGLSVQDPKAREFLRKNLRAFLFEQGEAAEIDTSKEGEVEW